MDEAAYRAKVAAEGYEEPVFREQPANVFFDRHVHDFGACLLLVEGEFTVETDDGKNVCGPGDVFQLAANVPHTERAGPNGAKFWAARKSV